MLVTQAALLAQDASAARANGGSVWTDGNVAWIDWRSAALRGCERGKVGILPRPVLATLAGARGQEIAKAAGAGVADAVRGA